MDEPFLVCLEKVVDPFVFSGIIDEHVRRQIFPGVIGKLRSGDPFAVDGRIGLFSGDGDDLHLVFSDGVIHLVAEGSGVVQVQVPENGDHGFHEIGLARAVVADDGVAFEFS